MPLKCPYTTKAIALIGYRLDRQYYIYIYIPMFIRVGSRCIGALI